MDDAVNMSLDEIIKQSKQNQRTSRSRGRGGGGGGGGGGGTVRGRGAGGGNVRGRGRGRGRGAGGGGRGRGRSQSRSGTPGPRQGRSRAGLEELLQMPQLVTNRRGGYQTRLRRSNSNPNLQSDVHSRLGVTTRRGGANLRSPLGARGLGRGVARGITKRGRGFTTGNRYSNVGLRSDQILREQQLINNIIKSQTFRRSRNNSFNASQLTVSVANDFTPRKRRNSVGNAGYLDRQSLAQLNNQFGGYNTRRGPGSVKSMGSNRSNRSSRSNKSNQSNRSNRSRGRGRGGNRGVGRKFVNKQVLNPILQREIAAIQSKSSATAASDAHTGVNFAPTPNATALTLHQRFAST
ncbi:serine/arginine repetitive matrix protein 2-like [Phthorimaea operculella]|nr:serine/arginine repetitive matrix protein 2-like [Phthorimaea operculella]